MSGAWSAWSALAGVLYDEARMYPTRRTLKIRMRHARLMLCGDDGLVEVYRNACPRCGVSIDHMIDPSKAGVARLESRRDSR